VGVFLLPSEVRLTGFEDFWRSTVAFPGFSVSPPSQAGARRTRNPAEFRLPRLRVSL